MTEPNTTSDVPSILTVSNEAVDPSMPLLAKGTHVLTITKVEMTTNQENGRQSIKIAMRTTEDSPDARGETTIRKNWPVFDQIAITPTEKNVQAEIQKRLVRFQRACGFKLGKGAPAFFPLTQYEGKNVQVSVGISPAKDGFEERNSFRYIEPKD